MNISTLNKQEVEKRNKFRCKHGHTGLGHPACYDAKNARKPEKVGFADIETTNLVATYGICLTYCIKEADGPIIKRSITLKDLYDGVFDRNLLKQFCEDAVKFDRLIFHYGNDRRFDMPFLRTRCELFGLNFPQPGMLLISDTYPVLRNKMRLHSNRLQTACDFFGIESKGHKLTPEIALSMFTGNKKKMAAALRYYMVHNVEDVIATEKLWKRIGKYTRITNTSV